MTDDRKTKPMSEPPEGRRVQIPERVGSVVLERELGEGGMGVVWRGRHELLGRDVAVKFLTHAVAGESDPGFKMFIDGARAAAAVKHPGLTDVYDAGVIALQSQNQVPYLVMELVEGPGLDAVLRASGPLSVRAALAVMEGVCSAIGELHAAGFVHRDIKPANVLLDADGGVHVTDFGLACERARVGMAKVMVSGTPAYMAPETFKGEVSARSDVYSLAMMLHELLTGEPPFSGDVLTLRTAHEASELPRGRLIAKDVPEALADVIERGANKNPMLRPRSALHLLEALQAACPDRAMWEMGKAEVRSLVSRARGDQGAVVGAAPDSTSYYQTIAERADEKRKSEPQVEEVVEGSPVRPGVKCLACGYELKGLSETGKCPECGGAIETSVRAKPLPCVQCEYDLVGLDAAGKCPECGREIRDSVHPDRLLFADPDWMRGIAAGMGLMQWGLAGLPLLMIGFSLVMLMAGRSTGRAIGSGVGMAVGVGLITAVVVTVIGVVMATAREPGRRGIARWVRVTWLAGGALVIVAWAVEWAEPKMPDGLLLLPGLHLLLLGIVLLGVMVERLGERVPDRKLVRTGRSVFWPWIGTLVLWLALTVARAKWLGVQVPISGLRLLLAAVIIGMLFSIAVAAAARKQLRATAKIASGPVEGAVPRKAEVRSPGPAWAGAGVAVAVFAVMVVPLFLIAPRFEFWTYLLAERLGMLNAPAGAPGYTVIVGGREFKGNPPVPLNVVSFTLTIVVMYGLPVACGLFAYLNLLRRRRDGVTRCGWCGYALSGLPEARCPECGVEIGGEPVDSGDVAYGRGRWWRAVSVRMAGAGAVFTGVLGLAYVGVVVPLSIPEPEADLRGVVMILVMHTAPFLAALVAFHFMTRSIAVLGGRTLCGKCGVELKGLKNGCCGACGARV